LLRKALGVARRDGLRAAWARARGHMRWLRATRRADVALKARVSATQEGGGAPPSLPAPGALLAPCVVIIAELTLQQCAKYRVWQKQEHFARLGVACRVVDWRQDAACRSAAALATQVILYRVPGYPAVLDMIASLRALHVPLAWEVDDLIFDRELFLQNRNIDSLEPEMREGILSGVVLYRAAMLACGYGIASTPYLARAMREAGLADVAVVENALDDETLALAERLFAQARARPARPGVLIGYGSGTKTHDADFRCAAQGLLRLMAARPEVRLRIVGDLTLPAAFDALGARVERLAPVPYARFLELLAECDISVAPLEATLFNDAKSNIKFLEASILGVASVCTPAAHFREAIIDGETGFFASNDTEWFDALSRLAGDAQLRARVGAAARRAALDRYGPEAVARRQVAPLVRQADMAPRVALRVLFANVYYAPRSYGGATLVVEEMARRLAARGDTEVRVVTSLDLMEKHQATRRTQQGDIMVFELPIAGGVVAEFDDPAVGAEFGRVLDATRPDVVHLHSVQWLSASLATACMARGIPYVITVHDAWWLCARQFMVRESGTYCFQTRIDLHICQNCVPGALHLQARADLLKTALEGAALILSPSESHRQLYIANGVDPRRIEVAPNGVRLPAGEVARAGGAVLRFGYVGGAVDIKGYSVVKRAFEALGREDWALILVDNTINLGFSSVDTAAWRVRGRLEVVPAYTQDGMDGFFAGIDVLVFASQWKESFGLTVREALARDVWVIATEGGGPAEAITDGVNGTLIPLDGRHEALREAIEALLDSPARLAGYRNPHAAEIMDYAAQAERLRDTLARVVATAT
jgi:glycosyltransferase involved in cell wall biosynthesis